MQFIVPARIILFAAVVMFPVYAGAFQLRAEEADLDDINYARLYVRRVLFHPGMLSGNTRFHFDAYYARPFGMRELETGSGMVVIPWGRQRFGFSFTSFGNGVFTENNFSLINVLPVGHSFSVTTEYSWIPVSIAGFGGMSDVSLTEGLYWRLPAVSLGVRFLNIWSGGDAHTGTGRNPALQFMATARTSTRFTSSVGLMKERGYETTLAWKNRLTITGGLTLVTEIGSHPSRYSVGIELRRTNITAGYHLSRHADLGPTSQVGLGFDRGRRKKKI